MGLSERSEVAHDAKGKDETKINLAKMSHVKKHADP